MNIASCNIISCIPHDNMSATQQPLHALCFPTL